MPEQNNPSQADNGPPKLRTMGVGELLDTVFSLYRAHFLVVLWNCFRLLYRDGNIDFDLFP